MERFSALIGFVVILGIAFLLSNNKRAIRWRTVVINWRISTSAASRLRTCESRSTYSCVTSFESTFSLLLDHRFHARPHACRHGDERDETRQARLWREAAGARPS